MNIAAGFMHIAALILGQARDSSLKNYNLRLTWVEIRNPPFFAVNDCIRSVAD